MRKYDGDNLVEITCNKCGKVEDVSEDIHGWDAEPFREFDLVYHYGSELYDFSGIRFDLCEYCVRDLVEKFKIPAEERNYGFVQAHTSDGTPFVYIGFEDAEPPTQTQIDEMYEELSGEE